MIIWHENPNAVPSSSAAGLRERREEVPRLGPVLEAGQLPGETDANARAAAGALAAVGRIEATLEEIFTRAENDGRATNEIADEMAEERLAQATE